MTKNSQFASGPIRTIVILGAGLLALTALCVRGRAQSEAPASFPPPRSTAATPLPTSVTSSPVVASPQSFQPAPVNNWTPLVNLPGFAASTPLLLTDGRVLVQDVGKTDWHLLTPDNTGSYINGTWSALAASPKQCFDTRTQALETWSPLYMASAVLPDGRVVMIGGEYNLALPISDVWSNLGEIYDPVAGTWTCLSAPGGWNQLGDAMSVVQPNGTFLLGNALGTSVATLNLSTTPPTWNVINPPGKSADGGGYNNEEGWTLLPNGNVLSLEIWNTLDSTQTPALQYSPSQQSWTTAGTAPDPLVLISKGNSQYYEVGPAVLRPDGTVFVGGATGFNDIYNTNTGAWSSGPTLPTLSENVSCNNVNYGAVTEQFVLADAPAALLPDGNVLLDSSPIDSNCGWINGTEFFEFNGTTLTQVAGTRYSSSTPSFVGRLLTLPTGQILFLDSTGDAEIYTATGTPNSAWAPTITTSPATVGVGGTNMLITGTQLNGLSGAVAYGDDYQAATNYPLVRITNLATSHVFYARTHGPSTMGVATGAATTSTYFDVPANIELGPSTMVVVANGIASTSVPITVLKPGSTALVSSANPSTSGQLVTFTATVSGTGGTPTGTVTFYDGATSPATSLGTGTLNGTGVATFATTSLALGSHTITATYGGDGNFGPTTSTAVTQLVNGQQSTIVLASSVNPAAARQSITFTATVTGTGGTPTGTVTFLDANASLDGNTVLGTVALTGGTSAITITSSSSVPLLPGMHSVTAQYSGDSVFGSTTSTAVMQVVNFITTTTKLVSTPNPSAVGQTVTFTATVTATTGTPSGGVTIYEGTTLLAEVGLNPSGIATFTLSPSPFVNTGSYSFTATYVGDNFNATSTSPVDTQVVGKASTVVLSSSLNPSLIGQSVTFTATVSGSGGTPTGTVTFLDGTASLGSAVAVNAGGVATFVTSALAKGAHSITASYSGDAAFIPATSALVSQTVNGLPSTTVLTSSLNPSVAGQSVTFTATVSGTGGTPTGTVTFLNGSTSLGTGTLSGGIATFATTTLPGGTDSITASYQGDSTFASSTSAVLMQVVTLKPSTTSLTSSPNPSFGQSVTFTATVSGSGGTPTGTVTFLNGSASLGTGSLNSGGIATFATTPTTALMAGTDLITASYGADTSFAISTSSTVSQVVNVAGFAAVSTSPTVTAGQSTTVNLTLYQAIGSNLSFALGCTSTSLPSKSSCTFVPPSVTPTSAGTTVQFTFQTASSELPARPSDRIQWPWGTFGIIAVLASALMVGMIQLRPSPRRRLAFCMCLAVLAMASVLAGCGASYSAPPYTGTPKGAATFTVTGTSGSTVISTPVTITVQ